MVEAQPTSGGRGTEHLARLFHTLASEPRLRLLRALRSGPRRVNDLAKELGMPHGRVSAHLRILADGGLVISYWTEGQRCHRLADARASQLLELTEIVLEIQ